MVTHDAAAASFSSRVVLRMGSDVAKPDERKLLRIIYEIQAFLGGSRHEYRPTDHAHYIRTAKHTACIYSD